MPRIPALALALLLVPLLAQAAPKKAKELLLQPLVDEITQPGVELTKAQTIAVKRSETCIKQDRNWLRAQQDEVPLTQLRELLDSAVVCWQGAEKKSAAGGEETARIHWWTTGRARYIESLRTWLYAMEAKYSNDKRHICQRLDSAARSGAAAVNASEGLAEKYEGAKAKALAFQLSTDSTSLHEAILDEVKHQRCGGN
jgi:hypothetical protein